MFIPEPPGEWYEGDVVVLFPKGARNVRAYTDSPTSKPMDWPLTARGRLLGLSLDEALWASGDGVEVISRGRAYKFKVLSKEGDFEGGRDW
jgi:hypothetical protein